MARLLTITRGTPERCAATGPITFAAGRYACRMSGFSARSRRVRARWSPVVPEGPSETACFVVGSPMTVTGIIAEKSSCSDPPPAVVTMEREKRVRSILPASEGRAAPFLRTRGSGGHMTILSGRIRPCEPDFHRIMPSPRAVFRRNVACPLDHFLRGEPVAYAASSPPRPSLPHWSGSRSSARRAVGQFFRVPQRNDASP